jgi:hypothetical protein
MSWLSVRWKQAFSVSEWFLPLGGGDFQGIGVYGSDAFLLDEERESVSSRTASIGHDETPGLSISMVASLHSPLLFHLATRPFYLHRGSAQTSKPVPAAGGVVAAYEPIPTCDRGPRESQPVVPPAYPVASHSRWRCAAGRCCSDSRKFQPGGSPSSSVSGVSGRMHSPLSDLCHLSSFPFDWG